MTKRENLWSAEFSKVLRSQGAEVYPLLASERTPLGWPDLLVIHRMWFGLIERKALYTKIEPHQLVRMAEIAKRRPDSVIDQHGRVINNTAPSVVVARHLHGEVIEVSAVTRERQLVKMFECTYHEFLSKMKGSD